jgi:hypothetical protein
MTFRASYAAGFTFVPVITDRRKVLFSGRFCQFRFSNTAIRLHAVEA